MLIYRHEPQYRWVERSLVNGHKNTFNSSNPAHARVAVLFLCFRLSPPLKLEALHLSPLPSSLL